MNPSVGLRIIPIVLGVLFAVVYWWVPRLTRPDLYFAVTVAPGFRASTEGRRVLRRYRQGVLGVSVVTLVLLGVLVRTPAFPLVPLVILLQLGAYFACFYRARRRVLPYAVAPTTIREAQVMTRVRRRIPGGWAIASGPFALLFACASYLGLHWQQIPTHWVVHWGANGQPDRWAARSFEGVFLPLLDAAATLAVLTFLLYGIAHWLRPIHAAGRPATRESRFRRTMSTMLLALEYFLASLLSWVALRPLLPHAYQRLPSVIVLLPVLIIVVNVAVLMWLGQGGSRVSLPDGPQPDSAKPVGDRTEDRFWKLGVFYFNRDDPSVMVERRFGLGYTMNFARPVAWLVLLLILVPISIGLGHLIR